MNSSEHWIGENGVKKDCTRSETELINLTSKDPVVASGNTPEPNVTVSVSVNDLITKELAALNSSKQTNR